MKNGLFVSIVADIFMFLHYAFHTCAPTRTAAAVQPFEGSPPRSAHATSNDACLCSRKYFEPFIHLVSRRLHVLRVGSGVGEFGGGEMFWRGVIVI